MTEEEIKQAEINSMQEKEMKLIKQIHEIVWDSGLTPEEKIDEIFDFYKISMYIN